MTSTTPVVSHNPTLWIPAGNWAEVAAAVLGGFSLVWLVVSYVRDRKDRQFVERSQQARRVGAWFDFVPRGGSEDGPVTRVRMTVMNSSRLPIRRVLGFVYSADGKRCLAALTELPVVRPPDADCSIDVPNLPAGTRLVVVFEDDSGLRWRKYGPGKVLEELDPRKPVLDGLTKDDPHRIGS